MTPRIELLPSVLGVSLSATAWFLAAAACPDLPSGITFASRKRGGEPAAGKHAGLPAANEEGRMPEPAKHAKPEPVSKPRFRLPKRLRLIGKGMHAFGAAVLERWLRTPVPGNPVPVLKPITGRTEVTMPHICPAPVAGTPPWQLIGASARRANWTGR